MSARGTKSVSASSRAANESVGHTLFPGLHAAKYSDASMRRSVYPGCPDHMSAPPPPSNEGDAAAPPALDPFDAVGSFVRAAPSVPAAKPNHPTERLPEAAGIPPRPIGSNTIFGVYLQRAVPCSLVRTFARRRSSGVGRRAGATFFGGSRPARLRCAPRGVATRTSLRGESGGVRPRGVRARRPRVS